jgi:septum formation inhibitor MinC
MDSTVQEEKPPLDVNQLTSVYIKMRDKRSQVKQEWEAEDTKIKEQMELIEEKLLDLCKELNTNTLGTDHGTVIRSIKSRYWTNDWDSMYQFIKEHDAFGLLEKRIQQSHMKEFIQENPDVYPAGMNVENQFTVLVRRKKEM